MAVSAPAIVTLTVYSVPAANADAYSAIQNQELVVDSTIGVLANDSNADGNPLSATLVTAPAHGQLTLNADGSFSYTPNAGFYGTDSFRYIAANGAAFSVPALVTLTVCSIPVATADDYALTRGQTLTVAAPGVLANDTNADGNPLSATLVSAPSHGQLTLHADGSFSFTPSDGYWGTDSFSYTANNGRRLHAGHGHPHHQLRPTRQQR